MTMSARNIAKALAGRKGSGGWMARCPAHDDREPSLSICDGSDGKVLVRCHAGCEQAQMIAALRSLGLWRYDGERRRQFTRHAPRTAANDPADRDDAKRTQVALAIWQAATSATGTLVGTYFISRGLHIAPPATVRFHAGLTHPSGRNWPAMIALVTRGVDDKPIAITRTFLARDGASKAPVDPERMILGPCRGGAVRLAEPREAVMVGEGIETCLAAMEATGRPAWAALSASGCAPSRCPTRCAT
jgi:putative DNA primase/helicase